MLAMASADPASHAPYRASARPSRFAGAVTTTGNDRASAWIASAASSELIGVAFAAYKASTAWAIAFMPDDPDTRGGRLTVRAGSYKTVPGRTRTSRPLRFTPPSVKP